MDKWTSEQIDKRYLFDDESHQTRIRHHTSCIIIPSGDSCHRLLCTRPLPRMQTRTSLMTSPRNARTRSPFSWLLTVSNASQKGFLFRFDLAKRYVSRMPLNTPAILKIWFVYRRRENMLCSVEVCMHIPHYQKSLQSSRKRCWLWRTASRASTRAREEVGQDVRPALLHTHPGAHGDCEGSLHF